jgi:integrase
VALEFTILTACRTSEVLKARWEEFDLDHAVGPIWTIPAERTKTKERDHIVPLGPRAVELIRRQQDYRVGDGPYVFYGYKGSHYPLAEKSMVPFLRQEGATETVHGFRASFKTWATEETKFDREMIEICLAHRVGGAVEDAYWRGTAQKKRRRIMLAWEEHCLSGIDADE